MAATKNEQPIETEGDKNSKKGGRKWEKIRMKDFV